jgi:predicted branched-subunit amino acid permease
MLLPYVGWTLGTLTGSLAGNFLPAIISSALGIALYAMFIAIIIPPSTKSLGVLAVVVLSAGISCLFYYVPVLNKVSTGIATIITALISATIIAIIFPKKPENDTQEVENAN